MTDPTQLPVTPKPFLLDGGQAADAVVNQCLDLEAAGEFDQAQTLLRRAAAVRPEVLARYRQTKAVLAGLKTPYTPDLAPFIMAETDSRRPFIPHRIRRQISGIRVAVAAGVLVTCSLMALLQRTFPEQTDWSGRPTPVSNVVEASKQDFADSAQSLASAVSSFRSSLFGPAGAGALTQTGAPSDAPIPHRREPSHIPTALTFGDTRAYEGFRCNAPPPNRDAMLGTGVRDDAAQFACSFDDVPLETVGRQAGTLWLTELSPAALAPRPSLLLQQPASASYWRSGDVGVPFREDGYPSGSNSKGLIEKQEPSKYR